MDMFTFINPIAAIGIAISIALTAIGFFTAKNLSGKMGSVVSAIAVSVGFSNQGWLAFKGDNHNLSIYFGAVMLIFGLISWLRFMDGADS